MNFTINHFFISEEIRKLIPRPISQDELDRRAREDVRCTGCKNKFNKYDMYFAKSGERFTNVFYCKKCKKIYKGSLLLSKYTWGVG